MLLDFWSLGTIIYSFLEFCLLCSTEGTLLSFTSICVTFLFLIISYLVWKSTDTPSDIPLPPSPPFVITIQTTTTTGPVQRHTLQDIRLFSRQPYFSRIHTNRRRGERNGRSEEENVQSVPTERAEGNQSVVPPTPRQSSSSSFGFPRLWFRSRQGTVGPSRSFRSFLRTRFHSPVLFHRLFPRHLGPNNAPQRPVTRDLHSSEFSRRSQVHRPQAQSHNSSFRPFEFRERETRSESASESQSTSFPISDNERDSTPGTTGPSSVPPEENGTEESRRKEDLEMDSTPSEGQIIKFTIRFLNDTQLEVVTHDNEKVGSLKRRHFSQELSENKAVRLIFNGRVMDNDDRTLKESGIFDQCVVHCLIVTPPPNSNPAQNSEGSTGPYTVYGPPPTNSGQNGQSRGGGPEPGMFFVTLVGVILITLWLICFNFGQQLFTQSAVLSLSVLTGIFLIGLVAFYLPVHPTQNQN